LIRPSNSRTSRSIGAPILSCVPRQSLRQL
jgi:hypothetical protein